MKGKFLGETKGNRCLPPNRTSGSLGDGGESHSNGAGFGPTKGNTDVPPDRSTGYVGGKGGGKHKAGGMRGR